MHTDQFNVRTTGRDQMLDITSEVASIVAATGISEGTVTVYIPHTTAAVTINENADPDVIHDVLETLDKTIPWLQEFYRHGEGNSAAHVKSSLFGCNTTIPIHHSRMTLGTWQSVFFCEFDGPRMRQVIVTVAGE